VKLHQNSPNYDGNY